MLFGHLVFSHGRRMTTSWCWQARSVAYRSSCAPRLAVFHNLSTSSAVTTTKGLQQMESDDIVFRETEQADIDDSNRRHRGRVEIKRTDTRGWGIFAAKQFSKGDRVVQGRAVSVGTERDKHTVQTDVNTHVLMDLPARLVNHVCGTANLGIRNNDLGAYDFYALREIRIGEELTWDYEASEYVISDFSCSCGSALCRKELRGFQHHGDLVIQAYGEDFVASYLRKL